MSLFPKCLLFMCSIQLVFTQYEVPEAKVEALRPKGFRVSIPGDEGIQLFAFHGNLNEPLNEREAGTFSKDISKPGQDGRWTFHDPHTKLIVGDTLYFWTFVIYNDGRGYTKDDQMFVVTELIADPQTNTGGAKLDPLPDSEGIDEDIKECKQSETTVNGIHVCRKKLIFNEQFKARIRKAKYWNVETKFAGAPDWEFVAYVDRPETKEFVDGAIHLKPAFTEDVFGPDILNVGLDLGRKCTARINSPECKLGADSRYIIPPILSTQFNTKEKFSFKYGKVEIFAKLPTGNWIYPEFYLNSPNEEYGPFYESGQIRIALSHGNAEYNKVLEGGVILGNSTLARNHGKKYVTRQSTWSDTFHKYGLRWTPSSITMTVDNKVYGTVTPPPEGFSSLASSLNIPYAQKWKRGTKMAPFDKEMYLQIGLGVGGYNFEDRTDGTKPWRNGERLSFRKFFNAKSSWIDTWTNDSVLIINHIKIWAL